MSKTITITSQREYLYDTPEHIANSTYKYARAATGVKYVLVVIEKLNLNITPIIKQMESEKAKIKLKGSNNDIYILVSKLITDTNFTTAFDIKT